MERISNIKYLIEAGDWLYAMKWVILVTAAIIISLALSYYAISLGNKYYNFWKSNKRN